MRSRGLGVVDVPSACSLQVRAPGEIASEVYSKHWRRRKRLPFHEVRTGFAERSRITSLLCSLLIAHGITAYSTTSYAEGVADVFVVESHGGNFAKFLVLARKTYLACSAIPTAIKSCTSQPTTAQTATSHVPLVFVPA